MKVHIFDLIPWPYLKEPSVFPMPNREYNAELGHLLYKQHFDLLELCDALGFDGVSFNEHHMSPYGGMPSPNVIVAAMTQRTRRVTLGIMGNCLPIRGHPLRVAEEVALLDVISEGRVLSGFMRGIPQEYLAYSVDPRDSRERFDEAWDLIIKAWTADAPFDWDGKYFRYKGVSIWPRPFQKPHPPVAFAGNSAESVEWAARKRVTLASSMFPTESLRGTFDYYRQKCREAGWTPGPEHVITQRHIYVAETSRRAREEAEPHLNYFYQTLLAQLKSETITRVRSEVLNTPRSYDYKTTKERPKLWELTFDQCQAEGYSIVGDPDHVIRQLRYQEKELGFGTMMGFFHFGSMPHQLAEKNVRLFASEVLPHVRGSG